MAEPSKYNGPTMIGDIAIDCTVTERHTSTATVTEHPVESGSNITDHIRPEPVQLSVNGIITNTPIGAQQTQRVIKCGRGRCSVTTIAEQAKNAPNTAGMPRRVENILDAETAWQRVQINRSSPGIAPTNLWR